ncbi:hybrid sensor histidine kinase/response regulator [Pseudomonas sp. 57B-090624]|uniref:Hpt domain-containing protein n=1 Tax=Pseudomonas sp. 57B-090624 TaxID=2213080 RepID=UPI000DA92901|nr:Hpt domain-containing protein [Pseudomonas sp. 57B-090624]PZE11721.1 hybrid sensor histidine kinase/response regulator [Pseudomonas sp. 57B-090624]
MSDRHDYVALEWVKGEIAETLKQARQALEAFVENTQDPTRMRFCLTYVHQVHGTLQMVEFYGAALLAEEMEQLAQALMEGRVTNQGEALEVLMQAILQLPVYLDRIQSARRDLPMVVLPLLNDLRAARGEKLLSETSLFSPDLSGRLPALSMDALAQMRTAELPVLLRKLRQMLQLALVGIIRNQDLATNLGYMARVFARLESLCKEAPLGPLWPIASGMVEGLANGSVVNGTSVRTLLRQIDKELKRLLDQGADGINQPAPEELVKNLLFYIAKAPAQSPRIRALKEQYRLDEALHDTDVVDEERARLAGPDRDAMRSVVAALCEELVRVKDSLDIFVRSDRRGVTELDGLLAPLKQIADTLAVLGFGQPRRVILDQIDVVHSLSLGQREPNDAVLMDVAGALLYVEATLNGMVGPADDGRAEESHLPTTDVAQIHQLVIKEARNGLEQAKDAIIEFIASQWNHEHLARVPELLTQVRGGLAMIPLSRAATLLEACNRYIQEQLLARKAVPNWQSLDTLADAITSVEYYLERLSEDHATQGDLILDVAEESLEALGYPLKEKPSILDRIEPEEEPLPLADPLQEIEVLAAEESELSEPLDLEPLEPHEDVTVAAEFAEPVVAEEAPPASLDALPELDPLPELEPVAAIEPQPVAAPIPAADELPDLEPLPELDALDEPAALGDLESLPALDALTPQETAADAGELLVSDDNWNLGELPSEAPEVIDFSLDVPLELHAAQEPQDSLEPLQSFDLDDLEPLPDATPLERFEPLEGEVLSLEPLPESSMSWDDVELAGLDLPEVELPAAPVEQPAPVAEEDKPLSMADVMAAPTQAINPPARDVPPSLLPPPADEEPVDDELLEVFIEEAGEVLETIGDFLPQWLADTENKDALTEIRRAFHTLKGSGRMVRALVIGELSWAIENLLNRVLDRSIQPDDDVRGVIQDVVALLPQLVDEFAAKAQRQRDDVDHLAAEAHALAKGQRLPKSDAPDSAQPVEPEGEPEAQVVAEPTVVAQAPVAVESDEEPLDPQLLEIFRNEAETHLDSLVGFLADCAQSLPQPVTDSLQRALHTLKGSAHMAGILPIAEIATPLEKLAKEYKTNLVQMDLAEAELLRDAEHLFRAGLEQLETTPLVRIPGTAEFLERVQQLHLDRLGAAEAARLGEQGETVRDPQLISIFLAEGMDILLDAEDLLRRWREHPSERQELGALLEELNTLGRGAEMAELPQIEELCEALLDTYGAVEEGSLAVSERFFAEAERAHEALIGMMDQVAAALQVTPQPERVQALRELLQEVVDPAALALLDPKLTSGLTVEELDDAPLADLIDWNATDTELPPLAELVEEPPVFDEVSLPELTGAGLEDDLSAPPAEPAPVVVADAVAAPSAYESLDEEMVAIFLEEAVDILESAGQSLDRWLGEPDNHTSLLSLQRDLHTLKGGARMAEIAPIGDLAHELESLYEGLVDRRFSYSPALGGLLQQSHDSLAVLLDQLQARLPLDDPRQLIQAIRTFRQNGGLSLSAAAASLPLEDIEGVAEVEEIDLAADDAPGAELGESIAIDEEQPPLALIAETDPLDTVEALEAIETVVEDLPAQAVGEPLAEAPLDVDPELHVLHAEPVHDDEPELDQWLLDEALESTPAAAEAEAEAEAGAEPDVELQAEPEVLDLSGIDAPAAIEPEPEPEPTAAPLIEPPRAAEPATSAFDDRDPELVEIFLEEGFDIIDSAGASLQRWMDDVNNILEVEALQRDLHTLKGGARMAEIREIGDLAHELEFLYEGLCGGRLRASPGLFTLLQACHDRLAEMLEAVRDKRGVPSGDALIEAIKRFRANPDEQLSMPSSVHLQPAAQAVEDDAAESDDILDIFLEEADDLLEAMERTIGRWEERREDGAQIDELLRLLHTLKGGARLAGQKRLGDLSHDLEQHLTEAQQQGAPWPDSLFLDVQSGFEGLQAELDQLRERLDAVLAEEAQEPEATEPAPAAQPPAPSLAAPIVAASALPQAVAEHKVLPFVRKAQEAAQDAASRRAPQELVKVPADLLEGLVNLAGETSIFRGRVEQQVSDFSFTLSEMEATIERVRDQLRRLDTETQAQILSRYQAEAERAGYEDFDPLEMDRHSQLQQLSRALFESASDLLDLKETLAARNRDAETLLLQQARVNTELQEGLMRTRMVPFDRLVPRLRRIVRQVASELGKQVEFVVGNAEGEMDRTVLERIVAPLEHMLRNAVDHGIEPAEVRRAAGKSEAGTIRLTLGREGGDIVLALADDGGGIRLDAVRRKAIERGMMDADSDLSDYDVLQFILEAGFSTAEKVTQISGRGVGMDVVHSEVKQLGGSMSIDSTPGEGTRFLIRLPFTVSVNRALMVLSGEDLYAIPLNTIEGIVRVSPYELEAYYQPDAPRFEYAGQAYELKYLGDLLNNGQQPKLVGQSLPLPVILVRSTDHAVAVQVDSLAGSREIVVKSLGPQFAGVHGISGATILGDGRVVVILDLLATIRAMHAHLVQMLPRSATQAALPAELDHDRPPLVMVVDDSVTVRKVTSRLLERNGMNVLTAKDGVDAISQLQEHRPDIMLLDIEMPRMDGFEVATLVRHDERLKDLPIIMITSRTGEKHRERAMTIGVNDYLGKPYQESLLLETIQRLVKGND